MAAFTNTFGGTVIYPADVSYRAVALTANVTLTWPTELATDTNVVSSIMDVTPSGAGFTIRMPDATQASVGQTALFFNVGASSFTVADNSGNTIQTIAAGQAWQIYLTGNATVNGTWRPIQYGAGTSSASASALAGAGLKAITTTLNQAAPTTLLSADYTLTSVDRARVLVWNGGAGTFTMPSAAAAGNDWFFDVRNSGTGGLTVATAGGEQINGQASLVFNPGDSARIITDGANFYTIGYGQSATFAFDYVSIDLTGQSSPYTLSGTNLNRIAYQFSGVLTANMQIIVPNTIQQYWVRNTTTGSYSLTVKTASGTGITIVQNGASILYCDGTNVIQADTSNLSTPISISQGGTGATTSGSALVNLGGTSLGIGVFTATNAGTVRSSLGAAASGANNDITSLSGLTTPLSVGQGGTGQSSYTNGQLLIGDSTGNTLAKSTLTAGTGITITNGAGSITIAGTGPDTFPGSGIAYSTGTAWGTSYGTSGSGTTIALTANPAFTGVPTAPTAVAGTSTTQIATTAFVSATAFTSALPAQSGNAGKFITTDGTNASWSYVSLTSSVSGTLSVANGGTGQSSYTDGQLLIGNSTGNTLNKATLTAGTGITITNGSGSITIAGTGPDSFPAAGIAVSTGSAWGTSYTTTGSGTVVALATSPSFTTPSLGVASATSINKVSFTTPATGSTLTIADGKTLTANNSITLAGTDSKTLTVNNNITLDGTDGKTLTVNNSIALAGTDSKTLTVNNSIALAGTDSTTMTFPSSSATIAGLGINQTFTGTQSFAGTASVLASILTNAAEPCTVSATAATGTINYDISTQSVLYYTSNAGADWTPNFRFSSGTSLNTAMSTGQAISVAFLVTQGATAYKSTAVQVDGNAITPKWQGGSAPSAGNASSIDVYTYTIIKTGSAAFTVLASQTQFK